jgi:hypothetical protein
MAVTFIKGGIAYGARGPWRSVALIRQLFGKPSGFAYAMRWRILSAFEAPNCVMSC